MASLGGVAGNGSAGDLFLNPVNSSGAFETRISIKGDNGNVGIGTSTPTTKFHVNTTGAYTGISLGDGILQGNIITGSLRWADINHSHPDYGNKQWLMLSNETTNHIDGGGIMFRTNNGPEQGYTSPSMVIDKNGKVGIGTSSPKAKLDVVGDILVEGQNAIYLSGNTSDTNEEGVKIWTDVKTKPYQNYDSNRGGSLFVDSKITNSIQFRFLKFDDGDYVYPDNTDYRIGLEVSSGGLTTYGVTANTINAKNINLNDSDNLSYISFSEDNTSWFFGQRKSAEIINLTNPITGLSEPVKIETGMYLRNYSFFGRHIFTDNGSVGFGTSDPTSKLQVVGLQEYADNNAAKVAGLTDGAFYRTGDVLKVVHS
jgi:hypothetical protein